MSANKKQRSQRQKGASVITEPKTKHSESGKEKPSDNDDVASIVEEMHNMIVLEDINHDPNGTSSKNQDKGALGQLIPFFNSHVAPVQSFDDSKFAHITKEHIGLLCDYMIKNPAIGYQSTMNYLSCIRRQLETKHNVQIFNADPNWYKVTRKRVTRAYVLACIKGNQN